MFDIELENMHKDSRAYRYRELRKDEGVSRAMRVIDPKGEILEFSDEIADVLETKERDTSVSLQ